jgi:hypothetical protein
MQLHLVIPAYVSTYGQNARIKLIMDKMLYFGLFLKLLGYWLSWQSVNTLIYLFIYLNEKK